MKTCFALLIVLLVATHAEARIHRFWNYAELTTNATLVVVATPMKVALTSEIAALPNIVTIYPDGRREPVMGRGVETTFQILTVLKGVCPTPSLVLHHYQEAKPTPSFGPPGLVAFEPKDKKRYLLFLQPEADGRYVAVSGQTDPDDSIKPIADNYP